MDKLSEMVLDLVISRGACAVGIVTSRTLEAVSPEEAIEMLSHMPDEKRRLYEDIS